MDRGAVEARSREAGREEPESAGVAARDGDENGRTAAEELSEQGTGDMARSAEEDGDDAAAGSPREDERPDEEEVVDVSPSGCTVSSLASAKREAAAKVKNIFVFDNTFTVLPPSITHYKNLRKLKFFSNEVQTLPPELGDLTKLEHLYLKIPPAGLGSLPPLGNLRSLKALELHQVPARPSASSLSREIAQLHSLTRLSVCHFSISWLPAEIGSLTNLEEIDLSFNKLKSLPKEFGDLVALRSLRVASNKLTELPAELAALPSLSSIDVSHNRITSLASLRLDSMPSLKILNAEFNKLHEIGDVPEWTTCLLEGNERLNISKTDSGELMGKIVEDYLHDWEPPVAVEVLGGKEGPSNPPLALPSGMEISASSRAHPASRGRRAWKRQDNQQQKARHDRLNCSRKHRCEEDEEVTEASLTETNSAMGNAFEMGREDHVGESSRVLSVREAVSFQREIKLVVPSEPYSAAASSSRGEGEKSSRAVARDMIAVLGNDLRLENQEGQSVEPVKAFRSCQPEHSLPVELDALQSAAEAVLNAALNEEACCREAIVGDGVKRDVEEVTLDGFREDDAKDAGSESLGSCVTVAGAKVPRRQDSDGDRNPKPSKRRRSVREFSEVSFKYCIESFVGFSDHLHDGFYDAGRDRPFLPLDVLEKEQLCYDSREVILVDREKDEELDVMALSAQRLLAGLDSSSSLSREGKVTVYQRMATLALFVSDCFGGSDKTHSISNMRRSALGGTAGMPFVCSCSCSSAGTGNGKVHENSGALATAVPTVHALCEGAVRLLKAQEGSNILPIGSFPYGVCRHRAILFKYLCDRADPVIPCELVRGHLDYMPHAWNVVLVENRNGNARMLVDACRPLDIREEQEPEYFCRYIPFRRIRLPIQGQMGADTEVPVPVFHEEIGHGASGAIVQRCTFGTFTAAAKVRRLEAKADVPDGGKSVENVYLSELRMLRSLQRHPCIVNFFGHQLSSGLPLPGGSPDVSSEPPRLIIFMEYIRGGSLQGFLDKLLKSGQAYVPPMLALHVARNVASALSSLHSMGILHRDLKSSNVLIDLDANQEAGPKAPTVKLCDFDSAVPLQSSPLHTCSLAHRGVPSADVCVGTPRWIAPEVLRAMYGKHIYGTEADVWSLGCLLVELLTLKVPYDGLTESEVHSRIQVGRRPQLPPELEKLKSPSLDLRKMAALSEDDNKIMITLVKLFYSCTDPTPSRRPSAKEVFSALTAAIAGRACTTFALHDGRREATVVSDTPRRAPYVSTGDEEAPATSQKSCVVGSNRSKTNNSSCSFESKKGTLEDVDRLPEGRTNGA